MCVRACVRVCVFVVVSFLFFVCLFFCLFFSFSFFFSEKIMLGSVYLADDLHETDVKKEKKNLLLLGWHFKVNHANHQTVGCGCHTQAAC